MALQAPANYSINARDPLAGFMEGIQMRQQFEARQLQQQEAENIKRDIAALGARPTVAAITDLITKYPQLSERFKAKLGQLSDEEKQNRLAIATPIYAAMQNGKPEVAKSLLQQQVDALRNAGNEQGARDAEAQIKLIELDPGTATTSFGVTLGGLIGPDAFEKTFKSLDAQRAAPVELREKSAAATLKEIEAQYAPEKIAADLGLVGAQAEQARAAAGASRAAARNSDAQASGANSGLIPPEKRPEIELKMRNEYAGATKEYKDVKSAYSRVLASQATAAGDLALIFNYMKMLDPGSAVREGEFANAQNAGGVSTTIRNIYNKMVSGERLSESQRNMFSGQAKALYNQAAKDEATVRSGMTRIATGYGLNPSNIFYEAVETAPTAPTAPAAAAPPPAAVAPPPSATSAGGIAAIAAAEQARRAAARGGG